MNRYAKRAVMSACALLFLWIAPSIAQTPEIEETVTVNVFNPDKSLAKTMVCPSGVSVGTRAVEFKGTVTTTSESGVSYQVLIRYGSGGSAGESGGALRHENLETSLSSWSVSMSGGETVLELNATIVSGAPLSWRAELWGDSPGTVHHLWQTRFNNNLSQNESCVYDIAGAPDLAVSINRMHPNYVNSETDGFLVPVEESIAYVVEIENVGDFDAPVYSVGGGFSSGGGTTGGPQIVAVQSVEPSHGAALECQILSSQDGFACTGSGLAPGESVDVTVAATALSTGSGIFSVSGSAPEEENFENNGDVVGLEIIPRIGFGHIHIQKWVLPRGGGGVGGGIEVPVDGVRFELLNADEVLLAFKESGPMDIDDSGDFDPGTERGMVWFQFLPPGEYIVREEALENVEPVDPLGGSIVVVVNAGQTWNIGFKNDPIDGLDWGDLPQPYDSPAGPCPVATCFRTTGLQGASHIAVDFAGIGPDVDLEPDGQPTEFAFGDDGNRVWDEDGVSFDTLLAGALGQITIQVFCRDPCGPGRRAHVVGWIDFDDNGMFSYAERIIDSTALHGSHTYTFPIPADATLKYGRFRMSRRFPTRLLSQLDQGKEDLASWGHFYEGEVEDYYIPPKTVDFGDAPEMMDPDRPDIPWGYPTTMASDGAAHITLGVSDFRLGDRVDGDPIAQTSTEADGDDYHNLYDEDGIRFAAGFVPFMTEIEPRSPDGVRVTYGFSPGSTVTVIPLANRDGKLDGWFDFNRNGSWQDPGEKVIDSVSVQSGPFFTPITFDVPESADAGWTFARFRFSTMGGLDAFGQVEGGEVEDYLLRILPGVLRITTLEDEGPGSIRQAIENANADGGADPVYIVNEVENSAGKTTATIVLESSLPEITRPVILSGGGSLVLDGSQAGDNANGLVLAGGSSGVHGVTITSFSGHGIVLNSEGNTVEDNVVFGNAGDGVRSDGSEGNRILSNTLTGNGGLAIDLGGDGPTVNDAGDADGVPNYPVITSVVRGSTTISGTIAGAPETTFLIQFFTDEECVESGRGEGAELAGAGSVTTDGGGAAEFAVVLEETLPRDLHVVATATGSLGTSEFSECGVQVTRIEHDPSEIVPESLRLGANYPNPFASETTIPFDVPVAGNVRVEIFNSLGRVVAVPVDRSLSGGSYRVAVSAATLASGVYYYRMSASGMILTGRMAVVK